MNLTLIKSFFTSDRIEPVKFGRVLRRSFRIKRNSNSIHEKRKSGNFIIFCVILIPLNSVEIINAVSR